MNTSITFYNGRRQASRHPDVKTFIDCFRYFCTKRAACARECELSLIKPAPQKLKAGLSIRGNHLDTSPIQFRR